MATAETDGGGPRAFLREALALLASRRLLLPALALAVLLTASNIVIASNAVPEEGKGHGLAFALAALVRVAGLLILAVALLRMMTGSERRPYLPDAGFWLYALTFVVQVAVSLAVRMSAGLDDSTGAIALGSVVSALLTAPLAVWFAALAVYRPVPWDPAPWLRGLGSWLPQFLFWTLLVVTPLAVLHAVIDVNVLKGARDWFWPLMLFDGPLSTVMALFGLSLAAAAYRRVARG